MSRSRPVVLHHGARKELESFPESVLQRVIHELDSLQRGAGPVDVRPVRGVGSGIIEIRVRKGRAFRVICAVGFDEAVYVLVAFEKKSRKTPRRIVDLIRRRYRQVVRERAGRGHDEDVQ